MRTFRLKEISTIINGATPSTKNNDFWNGDIEWITPKDLTNYSNKYIYEGHTKITLEGYNSCSTKLLPKGTVLLSSRAPIGYVVIAGKELCTNQGFKSIICNKNYIDNQYLYYWLLSKVNYLQQISSGSTFKELSKETLENVEIYIPDLESQQHIVNTIGTIDELMENYYKQIAVILQYGISLISKNYLNGNASLLEICEFQKGREVGSKYYSDKYQFNYVPYIRVGDLNNNPQTYIIKEIAQTMANANDILIAFDGAPGRIGYGLEGSFSSGIYKAINATKHSGLVFFSLQEERNQNIISKHAQGTTILHAARSIEYLQYPQCNNDTILELNDLFNRTILLKKKLNRLDNIKKSLLCKYFD